MIILKAYVFVGHDFTMGCLCKWFVRHMEEAKFIKQRSDPNTDRVEIWKTKLSADLLVRMKLLTLTSKYCSVFISDMLKLTKNN